MISLSLTADTAQTGPSLGAGPEDASGITARLSGDAFAAVLAEAASQPSSIPSRSSGPTQADQILRPTTIVRVDEDMVTDLVNPVGHDRPDPAQTLPDSEPTGPDVARNTAVRQLAQSSYHARPVSTLPQQIVAQAALPAPAEPIKAAQGRGESGIDDLIRMADADDIHSPQTDATAPAVLTPLAEWIVFVRQDLAPAELADEHPLGTGYGGGETSDSKAVEPDEIKPDPARVATTDHGLAAPTDPFIDDNFASNVASKSTSPPATLPYGKPPVDQPTEWWPNRDYTHNVENSNNVPSDPGRRFSARQTPKDDTAAAAVFALAEQNTLDSEPPLTTVETAPSRDITALPSTEVAVSPAGQESAEGPTQHPSVIQQPAAKARRAAPIFVPLQPTDKTQHSTDSARVATISAPPTENPHLVSASEDRGSPAFAIMPSAEPESVRSGMSNSAQVLENLVDLIPALPTTDPIELYILPRTGPFASVGTSSATVTLVSLMREVVGSTHQQPTRPVPTTTKPAAAAITLDFGPLKLLREPSQSVQSDTDALPGMSQGLKMAPSSTPMVASMMQESPPLTPPNTGPSQPLRQLAAKGQMPMPHSAEDSLVHGLETSTLFLGQSKQSAVIDSTKQTVTFDQACSAKPLSPTPKWQTLVAASDDSRVRLSPMPPQVSNPPQLETVERRFTQGPANSGQWIAPLVGGIPDAVFAENAAGATLQVIKEQTIATSNSLAPPKFPLTGADAISERRATENAPPQPDLAIGTVAIGALRQTAPIRAVYDTQPGKLAGLSTAQTSSSTEPDVLVRLSKPTASLPLSAKAVSPTPDGVKIVENIALEKPAAAASRVQVPQHIAGESAESWGPDQPIAQSAALSPPSAITSPEHPAPLQTEDPNRLPNWAGGPEALGQPEHGRSPAVPALRWAERWVLTPPAVAVTSQFAEAPVPSKTAPETPPQVTLKPTTNAVYVNDQPVISQSTAAEPGISDPPHHQMINSVSKHVEKLIIIAAAGSPGNDPAHDAPVATQAVVYPGKAASVHQMMLQHRPPQDMQTDGEVQTPMPQKPGVKHQPGQIVVDVTLPSEARVLQDITQTAKPARLQRLVAQAQPWSFELRLPATPAQSDLLSQPSTTSAIGRVGPGSNGSRPTQALAHSLSSEFVARGPVDQPIVPSNPQGINDASPTAGFTRSFVASKALRSPVVSSTNAVESVTPIRPKTPTVTEQGLGGLRRVPLVQTMPLTSAPDLPNLVQHTARQPLQPFSHDVLPQISIKSDRAPEDPAPQAKVANLSDPEPVQGADKAPDLTSEPLQTIPPVTPPMPIPILQPATLTGQITAPHDARHLPHRLAPAIVRAAARASEDERVVLTLDPVELGRIRFDFSTTNDRMQINLSVERADTLDLLRRHADILRAEFREAGFEGSNLNFSQWTRQGRHDAPIQSLFSDQDGDGPMHDISDADLKRTFNTTGQGLDLRL